MSRVLSTFVPIDGIDTVILAHDGAEVRIEREAPFSTDNRRLAARLAEHRNVVLAGEETLEADIEELAAEDERQFAELTGEAADPGADEDEPAEEV